MLALAQKAIVKWPVTVLSLSLVAHRENAVFRVTADEGEFALRLHRKGYRTDAELQSELHVMAALAEAGIGVPKPVASRKGSQVEQQDQTQVSLLTWLSGRPLGATGVPLDLPDRFGTFERLGHLIATMHTTMDGWPQTQGFTRQAWGLDGLLVEQPQWGRFWGNPFLQPEEKTLLGLVRDKLRKDLASRPFDMGLIHADLVSENILLDGDSLRIIDFDDSGWGYRLQDIATALVKHEAEPDFIELKQALFAGYRASRALNTKDVETFLLLRHLSYVGWIVPRMADEVGQKRCARFIANAVARARDYLDEAPKG
jgi:Ser/Thr protein kinase RdoA (MazF antagonist)